MHHVLRFTLASLQWKEMLAKAAAELFGLIALCQQSTAPGHLQPDQQAGQTDWGHS